MDIEFLTEDSGTRVRLASTGWEKWGPGAPRARKGYSIGWEYVLNVWAQRRTVKMSVLDGVMGVLNLIQKLRGGRAGEIARAGGEIPRA